MCFLGHEYVRKYNHKETTLKILGCKNVESYVDFVETDRDKEIYDGGKNFVNYE